MISKEKLAEFKKVTSSGEIYDSADEDFLEYQHSLVQKIFEYNQTPETPQGLKDRDKILREVIGTYGDNLYILPPINANCGLYNANFGKDIFINYNCNFVDDGRISFGEDCMIGPNVTFATAAHPISPKLRLKKMQYNKPITIGKNVWIGASSTILPGVTIGDNAVVGAGSVVTKDVAANTIVVGTPARKLRDITEADDQYYDGGKEIPQEIRDKYLH
ncbi:sugar O-acetyltransferase [Companilactobacillus zhongbaensis]|uniref:sugar O-acetyltransferase n=1 Tax=Companilactobacillus zhongbaensis TaxID=2486009 RepID=UPI000F7A81AE|nr:sugar O-acetyltransferase [Companilactobacillus zhongbaensis]